VGCGDVKNGKHYELLFERHVSDQKVSHGMKTRPPRGQIGTAVAMSRVQEKGRGWSRKSPREPPHSFVKGFTVDGFNTSWASLGGCAISSSR
jgi:hypothetical protein